MNVLMMRESGPLITKLGMLGRAIDQPRNTLGRRLHGPSFGQYMLARQPAVPQAAGKTRIEARGRSCHWTVPRRRNETASRPRLRCLLRQPNSQRIIRVRRGSHVPCPPDPSLPQDAPKISRSVQRSDGGSGHLLSCRHRYRAESTHQTPVESGTDDIESLNLAPNYW